MADWLAGAFLAFGMSTLTTPAGVSGAVFLVPVQVALGVLPVERGGLRHLTAAVICCPLLGRQRSQPD